MNSENLYVRVILRPAGDVHIAFHDRETISATPQNLFELFSDPIEFMETRRHEYLSSASKGNRKYCTLDRIPGVTLAYLDKDKRLVCDFPEIFSYFLDVDKSSPDRNKPIDMSGLEHKEEFSDEKSYLLKFYMELTNRIRKTSEIKNNIQLDSEVQSRIVGEILNTFFADAVPMVAPKELSKKIEESAGEKHFNFAAADRFVSVAQYAEKYDMAPTTVRHHIKTGRVQAHKEHGQFVLDILCPPADIDGRRGRTVKKDPDEERHKMPANASAEAVQNLIAEKGWYSFAIAKWIRTKQELDFYKKMRYREVIVNGRNALIIDINPDYIGRDKTSNREKIAQGKAPVYPDTELGKDKPYHIHHIGQTEGSAFAIVSDYEHNRGKYHAWLHPAADPKSKDLHGPAYQADVRNFWTDYMRLYDAAEGFYNIATVKTAPKKPSKKKGSSKKKG